jgi:hypothetical protein
MSGPTFTIYIPVYDEPAHSALMALVDRRRGSRRCRRTCSDGTGQAGRRSPCRTRSRRVAGGARAGSLLVEDEAPVRAFAR